jgi:hypothetical protein
LDHDPAPAAPSELRHAALAHGFPHFPGKSPLDAFTV